MAKNDSSHPVLTLSEARERGAVTVEQAAALLNIGRTSAYEAARSGALPTIRIGRRIVVPVPALLRMLTDEPPAPEPIRLQISPTVLGGPVESASRGSARVDKR